MAGSDGSRPPIAIISNSHTPYRTAVHLRIAREIPEIRLFSLYTHEVSNAGWRFAVPPEINPVQFGEGEESADAAKPGSFLREWKRGGLVIQWLAENDIRFVVVMGYNDPGRVRIMQWCRRQRIPCFLFGDSNIHGDNAKGFRAFMKRVLVTRIVRACTGVLACGTLGEQYFLRYGARPERIFYFPYEPDYHLIKSLPSAKVAAVADRFRLNNGRRRIVYSGRLTPVKRVDLLLDGFCTIAKQRPDWDLVIVGDGSERESLIATVPPDLAGRVIWTGFIDDQETVAAIYRASDVLVLPSDFEPWALVINEAAAAGMAVVSSNVVGAAAELVRDGINGRLFAPGDLQGLIEALSDVTDSDSIDRMKGASAAILSDWRKRADPVEGLRQALAAAWSTIKAGE